MSLFQFIASDNELPEMINNNCINDISELKIIKTNVKNSFKDIPYYTNRDYIYTIDWEYSDANCMKLFQYLYNMNHKNTLEIWSIWLCDYNRIEDEIFIALEKIFTKKCSYECLTLPLLRSFVECGDSGSTPNVLILENSNGTFPAVQ